MRELAKIHIDIRGLGLILYSPFAAAHIANGEDYLETKFWEPEDVARHIRTGTISAFCTGSPGTYDLRVLDGRLAVPIYVQYPWWIQLAVEVRARTLCIRDLYDLSRWSGVCPAGQSIALDDGYYQVAVGTRTPVSGTFGDDQEIVMCLNRVTQLPQVTWEGVPFLGDE